ncbi:MAG: YraN family protein [Arenicellales bacterium]
MKKDLKLTLPLHLQRGSNAETAAEKYLINQGLHSIKRNYRCKAGEIDLLMLDTETLVFIEVRYRSNPFFGSPAESITPQKILRLRKTAEHFLQAFNRYEHYYKRFDVIAISAQSAKSEIIWIKDAF